MQETAQSAPTVSPPHRHVYTDSPTLPSNFVLGSFYLIVWLFFHPTAWRSHIARIDSDLRPDFVFSDLSSAQWRNPLLRRLLFLGYGVIPGLLGVLLALVFLGVGVPANHIAGSVILCLTAGLAIGLLSGAVVSVASGIAITLTSALLASVALSLNGGLVNDTTTFLMPLIAVGIAGGVGSNVAAIVVQREHSYSLSRQLSSAFFLLIFGVAAGFGVFGLIVLIGGAQFSVEGGATIGLQASIVNSLAIWYRTRRLAHGIVGGVLIALVGGIGGAVAGTLATSVPAEIAASLPFNLLIGAIIGISLGTWFVVLYILGERVGGPIVGAGTSTICIAGAALTYSAIFDRQPVLPLLPFVLLGLLGLTITWWRPVLLYPLMLGYNLFLYRTDERHPGATRNLLRYHSAFWDEYQRLRLIGLDEHVVLIAERDPEEGRAALDYLAQSRQRWAAQAAQIELDTRRLERCSSVEDIAAQHWLSMSQLGGPISLLLRSCARISQDTRAALGQSSSYNQRLALREVEKELDALRRDLLRATSSLTYTRRFNAIAEKWRVIILKHVEVLTAEVEARQEIDSPYVIGVPLTALQEIFVGRTDISKRIEHLLLDRRSPPLLLYGQRRMGKTSLLNNLSRMLPSRIVPLFIDLQGAPSQAEDHTGLLYNLARGMANAAHRQLDVEVPPVSREWLAQDPFTRFDEWLDAFQQKFRGRSALLALDEFEAIDGALSKGRFDEERVLGMLRNLIQHRPQFKVLLAGSHTLDEFQRWSSYLINVQVIHLSYLKEAEAQRLIEQPTYDFVLRYEPEACQHVIALTRGHPYLVQLLCNEIVLLKNEQDPALRRLARWEDVEAAVPAALESGRLFFDDIQHHQISPTGLDIMRLLAAQNVGRMVSREQLQQQFGADLGPTLTQLQRRELIEPCHGGYRIQVELIRRWFAHLSDIDG